MNFFKSIAQKIGVDKSIAYSSGSNVLRGFTGLVSIYFVSMCLTGEEQGYYYTFGSILAIQVFFELGFTSIITQYVAHEQAHLWWSDDGLSLYGEEKYKSRLTHLLHFCIKWYSVIAVLLFVVLNVVGYVFFSKYSRDETISWALPWLLISLGTCANLMLAPLNSFVQGLGKVKEMSKIAFYIAIIAPVGSWMCLLLGCKLYVVGIVSFLTAILYICYFCSTSLKGILINLWKGKITERISYMKEIFPYQWKIALSWMSGYFIFQLFNPVLFATEGAKDAGQMGMTLTVLNAINALSMNWITTKVPLFSRLIELKDYFSLDKIFNKTVWQETSICLVLLVVYGLGVEFLRYFQIGFHGNLIGDRFLAFLPMLLMCLPVYTNQFVFSVATYLRCHKKEPFLIQSIVMGVLTMLSTVFLGKEYGLYGICIGYCVLSVLVSLPWGMVIFITKKKEWHGK